MPTISVIIPTFNRAALLQRTIASVLRQSYGDFELIVLDDGSSDGTDEVVRTQSDPRIRLIKHDANIGLVANWTYGVMSAKGSYLSILGDDDLYKPGFLLNRIRSFEKHPEVLAVTGAFDCIDLEEKVTRLSAKPSLQDTILSGTALIDLTLGFSGEWFNGATLYKASVLQSFWKEIVFAGTALDLTMHIHLALMPGAAVAYLAGSDMNLRAHAGQESIHNGLYIAESAAVMAMRLWLFKIRPEKKYVSRFRKRFASDMNHYARILWDNGRRREAKAMFRQALILDPFSLITLLKYLRASAADLT